MNKVIFSVFQLIIYNKHYTVKILDHNSTNDYFVTGYRLILYYKIRTLKLDHLNKWYDYFSSYAKENIME